MNEQGVYLDKRITEWQWYKDGNTLKVWIWLLVNAFNEDGICQGVDVKKGQVIATYPTMTASLGLSEQNIRTVLARLMKSGEIAKNQHRWFSVYTIINYSEYCKNGQKSASANTEVTPKSHRSNTEVTPKPESAKNPPVSLISTNIEVLGANVSSKSLEVSHKPSAFKTNKQETNSPDVFINEHCPPCKENWQETPKRSTPTSKEKQPVLEPKVKRFVKPTPEQVQAYCDERNNGIDGHDFWDFYESKGWVVGKSPMKDWKAAVRTWERMEKTKPQPKQKATFQEEYENSLRIARMLDGGEVQIPNLFGNAGK